MKFLPLPTKCPVYHKKLGNDKRRRSREPSKDGLFITSHTNLGFSFPTIPKDLFLCFCLFFLYVNICYSPLLPPSPLPPSPPLMKSIAYMSFLVHFYYHWLCGSIWCCIHKCSTQDNAALMTVLICHYLRFIRKDFKSP